MVEPADPAVPKHALVNNTLVREESGIVARCTCGWTSGGRFTRLVASALFRDHLDEHGVQYD